MRYYFVISGCTVGLIGDDITVVNEFSGSDKPRYSQKLQGLKVIHIGDTIRF